MIVFGCVAVLLALSLGAPAFVGILAFLSITTIHEFGHAEMARRLKCRPVRIDLFPLHGLCACSGLRRREDEYWIAWGGVLAQLPIMLSAWCFLEVWGRTTVPAINLTLIVLIYINGSSIILNLMPLRGLDGEKAWKLIPILAAQLAPPRPRH